MCAKINEFKKYIGMDENTYEYWATAYRFRVMEYFCKVPYSNQLKIKDGSIEYDFLMTMLDHTIPNLQEVVRKNYKKSKENQLYYIDNPAKELEALKKVLKMVNKNHCWAMFTKEYGVINKTFETRVKKIDHNFAFSFVRDVHDCIVTIEDESKYLFSPFKNLVDMGTNGSDFLAVLWYYAKESKMEIANEYENNPNKNYFKVLLEDYYMLSKESSIEVFAAEVYSLIHRGGKKAAHNFVKAMLDQKAKDDYDYENLTYYAFKAYPVCLEYLASVLSTLGADETEKIVLQYMTENMHSMSSAAYERLNYLMHHNDNAPKLYKVNEEKGKINLEVSSLKWREDDYNAFFDELKLEKRKLDYCLALRDENINITLNKAKIPSLEDICDRLRNDLDDEYGDEVFISLQKDVTIVTEGMNEKIDGIMIGFDVKECEHLRLFIYLMKIGKKLNIKFYSLFEPLKKDVDNQRQQALFLYMNLSPTVDAWESGVKDTVQVSLQHILNSSVEPNRIKNKDIDEF